MPPYHLFEPNVCEVSWTQRFGEACTKTEWPGQRQGSGKRKTARVTQWQHNRKRGFVNVDESKFRV